MAIAKASLQAKVDKVAYVKRIAFRFGRENWYAGPSDDSETWNGLKRLLVDSGRTEADISRVDEESNAVVSLLDNPGRAKFSTRGLVVGYVQSGKTGNIASVVAKAADTPFKFFLVLSGMTDTLRNQTQERLDRDVYGAAPLRWNRWTERDTDNQKGDFSHRAGDGFAFDHRKQIAVIKKNAGILRRVLAKLRQTDDATLRDTPFLIIDDECDQASVNSAALDKAVTRINGHIREILKRLPRAAYVGYTATPFANLLIDTQVTDDLYPRDFIHPLSRPPNYFGAERLFGRKALEGEHDDTASGVDMIRIVPDQEVEQLRPNAATKTTFEFSVTKSLATAIRYFILATAARQERGQGSEHSTMLVHTSVLNSIHTKTRDAISPHLATLAAHLAGDDPETIREMDELWEEEQHRVLPEEFDLEPIPFERIKPLLASVAAAVEIKVENWSSTSRISYSEPGRRYLVIGGNVLARGLTLEGLSVSYFLRSSSQYDTLMQMGRWFGFRPGFGDLPRVWMEESVRDAFFDLATVEDEIRRDMSRYKEEEITPTDFAVRIRKIPGMAITSAAKRRHAKTVKIGYAGSHQQTTRFHRRDGLWLMSNWEAGSELLTQGTPDEAAPQIIRNVELKAVVRFLRKYRVHPTHRQMETRLLIDHLDRSADQLALWTVAVVTSNKGSLSEHQLGRSRVQLVVRSALKDSGDDACVKALMSKADLFIDLKDTPPMKSDARWEDFKEERQKRSAPPLLLLYPIEKKSAPSRSEEREALNAVMDVLGMGIVFPGTHASAVEYEAANLDGETPEGADSVPASVTEEEGVVGANGA